MPQRPHRYRHVDVEKLFTHRWKLEQAEEAYQLFDTQTTGKAVILPAWARSATR